MVVFVFCSFFPRKSGLQAHAVEEHTKSFVENGRGILSMVIKRELEVEEGSQVWFPRFPGVGAVLTKP